MIHKQREALIQGACLLGLVALLSNAAGNAAGRPFAQPPKAPPGKLTAMIVAFERYKHRDLKALTFPVKSAVGLAKELQRLKYEVIFVTGPESIEAIKKDLAGRATLEAVRDGAALRKRVSRWIEDDAAKAQLGILLFTGHGVARQGTSWFLAAHDGPEDGGVSVKEVNECVAKKAAPVVLVFDACRTPVNAAPPARRPPAAKPARGGRGAESPRPLSGVDIERAQGNGVLIAFGPQRGPRSKTRFLRPTVLFASQADHRVVDSPADLTASLARGLQRRAGNRFMAHCVGMLSDADDPATLSLQAWFHYAITEVLRSTKLQQPHDLKVGFPNLDAVVAQLGRGGAAVLPAAGVSRTRDLTGLWVPQHGGYLCEPIPHGLGWRITGPTGRVITEPWVSGFVAGNGAGYDTSGKALFIDYLVDPKAQPRRPLKTAFGIDGKQVIAGFPDLHLLGQGHKWPATGLTGQPALIKIPMLANSTLNYIGFTDLQALPVEYDLVIRRIYLADARLTPRAAATAPVPLLPRWWAADADKNAGGLPVQLVQEKSRSGLKIGKGRAFRGGALAPPVWVRKGDKLELHLINLEKTRPLTVQFQLKEGFKHLIPQHKGKLTLPPGSTRKQVLTIEADGQADYFVVAEPSGDVILLSGCAIKPQWK